MATRRANNPLYSLHNFVTVITIVMAQNGILLADVQHRNYTLT